MLAQLVQRLELLTHVAKVQGSIPLDVSILNSVKSCETRCDDRFVVNALLTHIVIPIFTCVRAHMGELLVMFDLAPVWEVLVARATELRWAWAVT